MPGNYILDLSVDLTYICVLFVKKSNFYPYV